MTFPIFKEGEYVASKSAPDRKMQVETVTRFGGDIAYSCTYWYMGQTRIEAFGSADLIHWKEPET